MCYDFAKVSPVSRHGISALERVYRAANYEKRLARIRRNQFAETTFQLDDNARTKLAQAMDNFVSALAAIVGMTVLTAIIHLFGLISFCDLPGTIFGTGGRNGLSLIGCLFRF